MLGLITMPSYNEMASGTTAYAQPFFTDMWSIVMAGAGLIVGALLVAYAGYAIVNGVKGLFHKDDKFDD